MDIEKVKGSKILPKNAWVTVTLTAEEAQLLKDSLAHLGVQNISAPAYELYSWLVTNG